MPFALLITDFLKRLEAGDPKALELRDRMRRFFRIVKTRRPAAQTADKRE